MAGKLHRKRHIQLELESARRPDGKHGGWRRGAGRKGAKNTISHSTRPELAPAHPQIVTMRLHGDAPYIATDALLRHIRDVIAASHRPDFRIVEFNVLGNHLHLITEAAGKAALARGIQGFAVRLVRRINAALGRTGPLFAHRYHARALKTPREVRHALRYVLLNRKHHAAEKRFQRDWFDPWSSAAWFSGWARPFILDTHWKRELVAAPKPTADATTWLLTTGWKRHGLIDFDERPA
jgi:REP element-mobilizing transposase RayT